MAPPSPSLFRMLCLGEQFHNPSRVLERIESHPQDLEWTDHTGNTALHKLCLVQCPCPNQDALTILQAMTKYRPDLLTYQNNVGWTPLHYCVQKRLVTAKIPAVTQMCLCLINANPTAVSIIAQHSGFAKKTPFHLACQGHQDIAVLREMLRVDPSLATVMPHKELYSVAEESPVQLLWKSQHDVDKMALLLLTAFHGKVVVEDPKHGSRDLLHAACCQRVPRDYFTDTVLRESAIQARQPDAKGNLPLHYAVRHASVESQAYTKFVLEELLSLYPKACAIPDDTKRLPLHVALCNSRLTWHTGGIDLLVKAYPEALYTLDLKDRLYPVLASACHATQSRLHLSTTLELLVAAPGVVKHAHRKNNNNNTT